MDTSLETIEVIAERHRTRCSRCRRFDESFSHRGRRNGMSWRHAITKEKREMARYLRANATISERQLWALLRQRGVGGWKFRRQHAIAGYIVDFFCIQLALAIEVDGNVHDAHAAEDTVRDQELAQLGITVLRIRNEELERNPVGVAESVAQMCASLWRR